MRAALLHEANKPLVIQEVQIGKPERNEVLIRTAASGLCHSDLHFVDGIYPFKPPAVLGHESAGIVEAVGEDVRYVEPGDHVITCLTVFCGRCRSCLGGHPSLCGGSGTRRAKGAEPRLSMDGAPVTQFANLGGFAEQMLVHENAVVKIRKDMPLDRAALIGCGVTTGVGAVTRTAAVETGSDVAVIGCGGVGLSAVNGAALAGANRIIAVDRIAAKLDLARNFGATHTVMAAMGPTGAMTVLRSAEGEEVVPAVVHFGRDGSTLIGSAAAIAIDADPDRGVLDVRRRRLPGELWVDDEELLDARQDVGLARDPIAQQFQGL